MSDDLKPLQYSFDATTLEAELKDLFIKLYQDALGETGDDINVYGAPHLGSFSLVERNIDAEGLTVLRETTEARIRFLFKAWRHRNPERGLHFLRLYVNTIFGESSIEQLWQKKTDPYPLTVKSRAEIEASGESEDDYFLTSRVRVDLSTTLVPEKLVRSLRSAVAARLLLKIRISRTMMINTAVAMTGYGVQVLRLRGTTESAAETPGIQYFSLDYLTLQDGGTAEFFEP